MSTLLRVTIERLPDGRFTLLRELEETGDRWVCDDLLEAFEVVNKGFRPDGTPRTKVDGDMTDAVLVAPHKSVAEEK